MTSRPLDTDPQSWARYNAVLDQMGGPTRVRAAIELSETVRAIRLAGLKASHPELGPRALIARLVAEDYGVELPGEK
jgi:hypothetical protein